MAYMELWEPNFGQYQDIIARFVMKIALGTHVVGGSTTHVNNVCIHKKGEARQALSVFVNHSGQIASKSNRSQRVA